MHERQVIMLALKLITPPATEPVTLAEAKAHLRVDFNDDDEYISSLITAARKYCENFQNRSFITQTWELALDSFPGTLFKLPKPPLQSITSIKYYDTDNKESTFEASNYFVDTYADRVSLNYCVGWPSITLRPINGVIIRFVAGYTSVPEEVIHAIKILVTEWYENRMPIGDNMTVSDKSYRVVHNLLWFERVVPC